MKTEAIQEAFSLATEVDRENTVMPQARAELKALEESHARLGRELAHLVFLMEPLEASGELKVPGLATLNGARRAIQMSKEEP